MPRHLLFDLDGTRTDPRLGITTCIRRALDGMGVPSPAQLDDWIGPPLYDSFLDYLGSAGPAREALERYRERFGRVGLYENELYPGIDETLAKLRSGGAILYVVTSKPHVYAVPIVEHFGLARHFRRVYGSELDGTRGDKAALIRYVLDQEGIAAGDAAMIGDRRHDVAGARANGVRSIGVTWGYGGRQELDEAGADLICDGIPDLPSLFAPR